MTPDAAQEERLQQAVAVMGSMEEAAIDRLWAEAEDGSAASTVDDIGWWVISGMCGSCGCSDCHDGPCTPGPDCRRCKMLSPPRPAFNGEFQTPAPLGEKQQ